MINRQVLIEGFLLVAISFVSLVESIRLIIYKNPHVIYDVIGPGYYLLFLSIGLLFTSIIYVYRHLGRGETIVEKETSKETRIRLIGVCVVLALYLILIDIIGYGTATFVFFILMFRIVGIRSWSFNFVLSVFLATAYYFIFAKCADMTFPHGMLF